MAFITQERMAFGDTDASGLVHFAALFRFFEIGEKEALRELGLVKPPYRRQSAEDQDDETIIFPRVHVSCDYKSAAHADDLLTITTTVPRIGRTSLTWEIELKHGDDVIAEGKMITVCVSQSSGEPVPVPAELREGLALGSSGGMPQ